jgi:hypothetical protein
MTMSRTLAAMTILLASANWCPIRTDTCDVIEVNRYYDDMGRLTFTQAIYWRMEGDGHFRVEGWSMVKKPEHWPRRTSRGYECWPKRHLRVIAPSVRYTWTQYDPEIFDRQFKPVKKRSQIGSGK